MQKMASAATLAASLLCCFFISSTDSQDGCDLYAATGTNVTVPLNYILKELDTLRWLKDTTVIFNRKGTKVIQGKNDDVDSKGSLKLTQLTRDKSGRYSPEVHSADGIIAEGLQSVRLCVLDHVQKPTVTVKCTDSNANVSFTCSAGQDENLKWFMDGEKLEEKETILTRVAKDVANARFSCNVSNSVSSEISVSVQQNCYHPAPVPKPHIIKNCTSKSEVTFICTVSQKDKSMEFKWLKEDKNLEETGETLTVKVKDVANTRIFCNVSNPVSSQISEPAIQDCYSFPDELFGISIWVFIGGGAGFVLLVIIIVVVCCCIRARRKKRFQ